MTFITSVFVFAAELSFLAPEAKVEHISPPPLHLQTVNQALQQINSVIPSWC